MRNLKRYTTHCIVLFDLLGLLGMLGLLPLLRLLGLIRSSGLLGLFRPFVLLGFLGSFEVGFAKHKCSRYLFMVVALVRVHVCNQF